MFENHVKTVLLLGFLTGIFLGAGYLLGSYGGMMIGLVIAVLINFGSYFFSHKIVLAMYRAKPIEEKDNPELYKIVKEVSHLSGMPMPKLYIVNSANPNAFATGRNPKNGVIAVTTGIMDLLNENELKGVIAHEMSHIKNRDILIATIAATVAGVISYVGFFARWGAIFGGGDRDGNNIVSLLVLGIVTPLVALLVQMAISRTREYMADASAAKMLHSPHGLVSALEKLHNGVKKHPLRFGNRAGASLFIVNPFSLKGMISLFSTHPPMDKRIAKLKSLRV
jgi:heat shock protein HtpX